MGFGQRAGRFNELGQVLSIKPSTGTPMTLLDSYNISSSGQPASVIHARDPIFKPGTETALNANATFFEPVESYDASGVPQFTQLVVNGSSAIGGGADVAISQYKEYFTIVNPGIVANSRFFLTTVGTDNGSAGTLVPKILVQPKSNRKLGTVDVSLSNSSDSDTEVAYKQVDWCSIQYSSIFQELSNRATSVRGNQRTFSNHLAYEGSDDATNNIFGATFTLDTSISGETLNVTDALASGAATSSTTTVSNAEYKTDGIYRSKTVPFMKRADGIQIYIKTNVTFS